MKRIGILLGLASPFIGLYRHDERVFPESTQRAKFFDIS
jgi:hypothetical protein